MERTSSTAPDRPTHGRQRLAWADLILVATCAVPFALLAWPLLRGELYAYGDLLHFHIPLRHVYARSLERGESFDWNPYHYCGHYLLGEGQVGTYHPFHLLLYRFLPFPAAFGLEFYASYPFALAGMWLFLRRRGLGARAGLAGAAAFALCGFHLSRFVHMNAVAVLAHTPWLLWALDRVLREGDPRRARRGVLACSLVVASQVLLGYPEFVWYSSLAACGYGLLVVIEDRPPPSRCLAALGALALGVAAGAIQLLPTVDALLDSTRRGADPVVRAAFSIHPMNLLQLFGPYLYAERAVGDLPHEHSLYPGAVVLTLALSGLLLRIPGQGGRRLFLGSLLFSALALWMALGTHGGLYELAAKAPLLRLFRFPARHVALFQLGLCVASALAIDRLEARGSGGGAVKGPPRWPFVLLTVAATAAAALPLLPSWREAGGAGAKDPDLPLLLGPALFAAAGALVVRAARGCRASLALLGPLLVADVGAYGLTMPRLAIRGSLGALLDQVPCPPGDPGPRALFGINTLAMRGWRQTWGYAGLPPKKELDYRDVRTMRLAGVGWVDVATALGLRIERALGRREAGWLEVPGPVPRARLVTRVVRTASPKDVVPSLDEASAAADLALDLPPGDPGTAEILSDRPGDVRVGVSAPARRLLVLSESFHPGWRVRIRGEERPSVRVNGDFLGALVEPGTQEVAFEFRPASRRFGAIVSAAALLTIAGVGILAFRRSATTLSP